MAGTHGALVGILAYPGHLSRVKCPGSSRRPSGKAGEPCASRCARSPSMTFEDAARLDPDEHAGDAGGDGDGT
jgi:hypothetical protein